MWPRGALAVNGQKLAAGDGARIEEMPTASCSTMPTMRTFWCLIWLDHFSTKGISMSKVAVVYHSGYGHTSAIAQAVARGAAGVGWCCGRN